MQEMTNKFWNEHKEEMLRNKYKNPVIDGVKYYVGDDNSSFRGFDGSLFTIKFDDGTIVTTKNLRYNGNIPAEFVKDFPNNAEFIRRIETHLKGVYLGDEIFWVMETGDILNIIVKKTELFLDGTSHYVLVNDMHKCNVNSLNNFIFLRYESAKERARRYQSVEELLGW